MVTEVVFDGTANTLELVTLMMPASSTTESSEGDDSFGIIYRLLAYATWIAFWVIILGAIIVLLKYCCLKCHLCCYSPMCRTYTRKIIRPFHSNQRCHRVCHLGCLDTFMLPTSSTDATEDDLSEIFRITSPPDYATALGMPKPERPSPSDNTPTIQNTSSSVNPEISLTVTSQTLPASTTTTTTTNTLNDDVTDSSAVNVVVDMEPDAPPPVSTGGVGSVFNPLYEFDNAAFVNETNEDNDGLPSYELALEILERANHVNTSL